MAAALPLGLLPLGVKPDPVTGEPQETQFTAPECCTPSACSRAFAATANTRAPDPFRFAEERRIEQQLIHDAAEQPISELLADLDARQHRDGGGSSPPSIPEQIRGYGPGEAAPPDPRQAPRSPETSGPPTAGAGSTSPRARRHRLR